MIIVNLSAEALLLQCTCKAQHNQSLLIVWQSKFEEGKIFPEYALNCCLRATIGEVGLQYLQTPSFFAQLPATKYSESTDSKTKKFLKNK